MPDLPKPLPRRSFTAKQRAWIVWNQSYKCAHCECSLITRPFQIDHIHRLDALGTHEPDNWQALCVPCHAIKTKTDNREAKKGRRIRGENKPRVTKAIPSRPFGRMPESRSPSKWQSAGFSKTLRRKISGKVEAR
jgi:5-methylcytosine-specific restriction endonuclease McrA